MKKLNKKILIALAAALFLGSAAFAGYEYQKQKTKKQNAGEEAKEVGKNNKSAPTTETTTPAPEPQKPATPAPTTTQTSLGELKDVSLTVYVVTQTDTNAPVGSLLPYFYLPSGLYTIQKLSGASWVDVATNINYPGHGGLNVAAAAPAEDNINYRVLKIVNGTFNSVSKTFVVKRTDLVSGVHTYN